MRSAGARGGTHAQVLWAYRFRQPGHDREPSPQEQYAGDPSVHGVDVYVPAGHDGEGLPLLVDLVGLPGSGLSHTNWVGFRENLPERLDRLIGEQRMPPVVVAFPDCFTRLGGNQYINSASMGAWEDFLLHEMLPAIGFERDADWNPIWHPTGLGSS
jgi:hypothetical protein